MTIDEELEQKSIEHYRSHNPDFIMKIDCVLHDVRHMLIEKNKAYGNSALEPLRCFSKASSKEAILVRIDDKLSRIMRGQDIGEDTVMDLIGYLVLLRLTP